MTNNNDQLGIPFDQYQRYRVVAEIINKYRDHDKIFKILDVGSSNEENLKKFLPYDDIYFLDKEYPTGCMPKNYIKADICDINLENNFDFVVSIDSYEHIPPIKRKDFIKKLVNLSNIGTIIAAPFDTEGVKEKDKMVNELYKARFGTDHRWLIEHIQNGLPSLEYTIQIINELGFENTVIPNGYIYRWVEMISNLHTTENMPELSNICKELNEFYNKNFYKFDNMEPAYRHVIIIDKNNKRLDFSEIICINKSEDFDFDKNYNLLQSYFIKIRELLNYKIQIEAKDKIIESSVELKIRNARIENLIKEKDDLIKEKDARIEYLIKEKDARIEYLIKEKDDLIKEKDDLIKEKDVLINEKDSQIENLINEKNAQIENIKEKYTQIVSLNKDLMASKDKLNNFEDSVTIKYVHSITSVIDKIFPDGTRYGEFRKIIVFSIRTITKEGIRSYLRHIRIKAKRREFRIVDKKLEGIEDRNIQLQQWIIKYEPNSAKLEEYKEYIKNFKYKPKISIVTPVYNPDVAWISAAIESVLRQTYENWELCIADASTKKDIKKCIENYIKKDSRIKVKFLTENKGIAGNSNEALSLATGEYIGLLDHDDEISPDALYEVVKHLQSIDTIHTDIHADVHTDIHADVHTDIHADVHTDIHADMIYSDEDKIDINGNRKDAFFKPDWSLDTFLSCMYTCHFGVYKKKIIDEIKGFRIGYDGSQDYDLVLRFIEKTKNIRHIPKILYHWRMVPGSAAATVDAKGYAYISAKKALTEYIKRNNIKGEILNGLWTGSYRIKRELYGTPLVSIIIPTRDKADILKRCIDSILTKTNYSNFEIIIIDNNSIDKDTHSYFESMKKISHIKILQYQKEFNFSAINNFAVENASGDIIIFLNNDTEIISEEWITAMLEHIQRNEVGIVGAKLLYPNRTIQHAGVILGLGDLAGHSHINFPSSDHGYFGRINIIQNLSAVTAACMMIRKNIFEKVGGFDENIKIAFNDIDLCLKIRDKGYLIVYTPYAELYHYESLSRGFENTPEKQKRFLKEIKYLREKWGDALDRGDPYYNPNLTLSKGDFSINLNDIRKKRDINDINDIRKKRDIIKRDLIEKIVNNGERVTHLYPNDCFYAHLSIYKFASQFCKDKYILDAGSGAGYGSAYFAKHGAISVLGVDNDNYAIEFSKNYFKNNNLKFEVMDLGHIGELQKKFFGMIFASNSLEHVKDVTNFLDSACNILKDDGFLIIAIPPIISDGTKNESLSNPHHQNSLSLKEWHVILQKYFKYIEIYRHDFNKKNISLNFSNKPEESKISENDFSFSKVPIESLYTIPSITSIFVCKK